MQATGAGAPPPLAVSPELVDAAAQLADAVCDASSQDLAASITTLVASATELLSHNGMLTVQDLQTLIQDLLSGLLPDISREVWTGLDILQPPLLSALLKGGRVVFLLGSASVKGDEDINLGGAGSTASLVSTLRVGLSTNGLSLLVFDCALHPRDHVDAAYGRQMIDHTPANVKRAALFLFQAALAVSAVLKTECAAIVSMLGATKQVRLLPELSPAVQLSSIVGVQVGAGGSLQVVRNPHLSGGGGGPNPAGVLVVVHAAAASLAVVPGETRGLPTLFLAVLDSVRAGVDDGASPDKRYLQAALSRQAATLFADGGAFTPEGRAAAASCIEVNYVNLAAQR